MKDYDPNELVTLLIGSNNIGQPTSRTTTLADAVETIAELPTPLGISAMIVRSDGAHLHDADLFMRLRRKFSGQE